MIRGLSGTVLSVDGETICLDVSGFGIEIFASGSLLSSAVAGEPLRCMAYLQTSDAGLTMFGFSDDAERALFLEITQVKTMGGKLSIALLRHMDAAALAGAIAAGDAARLSVPGLGAKRAERIIFEMRPKIAKRFASLLQPEAASAAGAVTRDSEVVAGLVGLGFSQGEAARAVAQFRAESQDREISEEDLMMGALGKLQKR
jgi:Holliday junction DNA helicase RuvA